MYQDNEYEVVDLSENNTYIKPRNSRLSIGEKICWSFLIVAVMYFIAQIIRWVL